MSRHAFMVSEMMGAPDNNTEVDPEVVQQLRAQIPVSRDKAMRWVSPEFDQVAEAAYYQAIGAPDLSCLTSGWDIFSQMAPIIDHTLNH